MSTMTATASAAAAATSSVSFSTKFSNGVGKALIATGKGIVYVDRAIESFAAKVAGKYHAYRNAYIERNTTTSKEANSVKLAMNISMFVLIFIVYVAGLVLFDLVATYLSAWAIIIAPVVVAWVAFNVLVFNKLFE